MKYVVTLTEDVKPGEIPGWSSGIITVIVSGCGRHKGTLGFEAWSKRTAQRWVKKLRAENPGKTYDFEEAN